MRYAPAGAAQQGRGNRRIEILYRRTDCRMPAIAVDYLQKRESLNMYPAKHDAQGGNAITSHFIETSTPYHPTPPTYDPLFHPVVVDSS